MKSVFLSNQEFQHLSNFNFSKSSSEVLSSASIFASVEDILLQPQLTLNNIAYILVYLNFHFQGSKLLDGFFKRG